MQEDCNINEKRPRNKTNRNINKEKSIGKLDW